MKIGKKSISGLYSGLLLSIKVCLVTGLTCIQCHTRLHKGCNNLDYYGVLEKKCVEDEVCAKIITWNMKRGPSGVMIPYDIRTIRDCAKPDPKGLNTCLRVGNNVQPKERCFCNDTNFCNSSPEGRHRFISQPSDKWKLLMISLLIYHCTQFFLAFL